MGVEKSPQKDDGSGIMGPSTVGRDELIRLLGQIHTATTWLIDIANKEFAWCDTEMLKRRDGFEGWLEVCLGEK